MRFPAIRKTHASYHRVRRGESDPGPTIRATKGILEPRLALANIATTSVTPRNSMTHELPPNARITSVTARIDFVILRSTP